MLLKTTEVFRYACEPVGNVLTLAAFLGVVQLWRQRQRRLLLFLIAPIGLAALAALLGQYPYGASRVMVLLQEISRRSPLLVVSIVSS